MLAKLLIVSTLLFVNFAGASPVRCNTRSAQIKGTIAGAAFRDGECVVTVSIESSKASKVCPMKLQEGQEIVISVPLTKKLCPLDEGPVKGVYSSSLLGHFQKFRGTVDRHRVN